MHLQQVMLYSLLIHVEPGTPKNPELSSMFEPLPRVFEDPLGTVSDALEEAIDFVTEDTWPMLGKACRADNPWKGGDVQDLRESEVSRILQCHDNVGEFEAQVREKLQNAQNTTQRLQELATMLKKMAIVKDLSEFVLQINKPEFQKKIWEDCKDWVEMAVQSGETMFMNFVVPGSNGVKSLSDFLATEEGSTVDVQYRLRAFVDIWSGGWKHQWAKHFSKGFLEEFLIQVLCTHPKTTDEHGSTDFSIQFALEDTSGVFVGWDSNLHGHTIFQGLKWNRMIGPGIHVETSYEEKYTKAIQFFQRMLVPARMAFEAAETGKVGLMADINLLDQIRPEQPGRPIGQVRKEPASRITARGLYWNYLAMSWVPRHEFGTGFGATFFHQYDLSRMARENPALIVGLYATAVTFNIMGTAAGIFWLAPWVSLVTQGRGTLTSLHLSTHVGATAADILLGNTPIYKKYSYHSADVWGFIYGYFHRPNSKKDMGSDRARKLFDKVMNKYMADHGKDRDKIPVKWALQTSLFFTFGVKEHIFGEPPQEG